jgi:hypothetical protein
MADEFERHESDIGVRNGFSSLNPHQQQCSKNQKLLVALR